MHDVHTDSLLDAVSLSVYDRVDCNVCIYDYHLKHHSILCKSKVEFDTIAPNQLLSNIHPLF